MKGHKLELKAHELLCFFMGLGHFLEVKMITVDVFYDDFVADVADDQKDGRGSQD